MDSDYRNHERLEEEIERLKAQLSASEGFRESLTERFRSKHDDVGDAPGWVKWVVYLRHGYRLFEKADTAKALED